MSLIANTLNMIDFIIKRHKQLRHRNLNIINNPGVTIPYVGEFTFYVLKIEDFLKLGSYVVYEKVKPQLIQVKSTEIRPGNAVFFLSHRWEGDGRVDDEKNENYNRTCNFIKKIAQTKIMGPEGRPIMYLDYYKYIYVDNSCITQAHDPPSQFQRIDELNKINKIQEICTTIINGYKWESRGWLIGELMMAMVGGFVFFEVPETTDFLDKAKDVIKLIKDQESPLRWKVPVLRKNDKVLIFYNISEAIKKIKILEKVGTYTRYYVALNEGTRENPYDAVKFGGPAMIPQWKIEGMHIYDSKNTKIADGNTNYWNIFEF